MTKGRAPETIDIAALFKGAGVYKGASELHLAEVTRVTGTLGLTTWIVDSTFASQGAQACFMRTELAQGGEVIVACPGSYRLEGSAAGGWLLLPDQPDAACFWIPVLPMLRTVDSDGHVLTEKAVELKSFAISEGGVIATLKVDGEGLLDATILEIPSRFVEELNALGSLELQPYFLYASHGTYGKPAHLFNHLVFGHLYNGEFAWPTRWRIPDELEAYALYLVLTGLETATGKGLYGFLKRLVLIAVVSRQGPDGGWYHGEWTHRMECHVRMHVGGMHLLSTAVEELEDPTVLHSLRRAAEFVAQLRDETDMGSWFLHDTLELSPEAMDDGPFDWYRTEALGKSATNMLVLNTHLDTLIALARYRQLSEDPQFDDLMASARRAAVTVVSRQPHEAVYRFLYRLVDMTLLPVAQARALPLPMRVVKRLTWKYLVPRLHYLRSRWPRLVMPNGFIDRALSLKGVSHAYQTVNIWDLVRYRRRFADPQVDPVIHKALEYTQNTPIRAFWVEQKKKGHALGFWVDALWHLCMADPEPKYRQWLAEAVLMCHDGGWGVSPAVLGANTEAVSVKDRVPTPSPGAFGLIVVNLGRADRDEVLVVNPTHELLVPDWQTSTDQSLWWMNPEGETWPADAGIPPRAWIWGRGTAETVATDGNRRPLLCFDT